MIAPWAAIATEPEAEELTEAPETLPEGDDPLRAETLADAEVDPVEEIVVRADRVPQTVLQVPAAVSVVDQQAIQFARQQLTLGESLLAVPGVFTQNRQNFSQDLRISIRGFGARARFGIRGIRLLIDGIPTTLPDGQGQVDTLQLTTTGRIEVMRGPSASLYGSAAGGVIRVESEPVPEVPLFSVRAQAGSNGYQSYDAKAMGKTGPVGILLGLSRQVTGGYRGHSHMESNVLNGRVEWAIDDDSELIGYANLVYGPVAQDSGALSAAQVSDNRHQAQACNTTLDAGESVNQFSGALKYRHAHNAANETTATGWVGWRDFSNRLAFQSPFACENLIGAVGKLDRIFSGASLQHVYESAPFGLFNQLLVGGGFEMQNDDRSRRSIDGGIVGGKTIDQLEDVLSLRAFIQDEWELPADWTLGFSLGFDWLRYDVTDRLVAGGGESSVLHYSEWSPSGTLRWNPHEGVNPYLRISTSFEPPTTTELRRPDQGGFDPNISPQRAVNYELGVKGLLPGTLRYELAAYYIKIDDEILKFDVEGEDFYRNAGRSDRTGVELGAYWQPIEPILATAAYTFSKSSFIDHQSSNGSENFNGNQVPGVPEHLLYLALQYNHPGGLFLSLEGRYVGSFYADDANQVKTDPYGVLDVRAGWRMEFGAWRVTPQLSFNNLLDAKYMDNVRTGEKWSAADLIFEPAPGFEIYGGLSAGIEF
ncbi:MAG: TonB-dependent receptor [Myxococcota bacterium]|nr:TonB-dependent receptor [Myxococcota bacterium]MDP7074411.1 TonB-dependent receptor [Myxococcota bacterium]MDP7434164.1 TonB-dependent receptor [Myxococcota bacterium]